MQASLGAGRFNVIRIYTDTVCCLTLDPPQSTWVGLIPAETIAVFHDFPVSEMSLHQLPHVATSQLPRKFVDSYGSSCSAWDMVNCAANYRPDQAGGLLNSKTGVNSWGFVGFRRI